MPLLLLLLFQAFAIFFQLSHIIRAPYFHISIISFSLRLRRHGSTLPCHTPYSYHAISCLAFGDITPTSAPCPPVTPRHQAMPPRPQARFHAQQRASSGASSFSSSRPVCAGACRWLLPTPCRRFRHFTRMSPRYQSHSLVMPMLLAHMPAMPMRRVAANRCAAMAMSAREDDMLICAPRWLRRKAQFVIHAIRSSRIQQKQQH